jgi:hypothetical protein
MADVTDADGQREARQFHRDQHARVLALLRAYRAGNGRDLADWQVLIDDLTPPLPPVGDPDRVDALQRVRRVAATLLALVSLSSRLLDAASAEPDEWLRARHEALLQRLAEE